MPWRVRLNDWLGVPMVRGTTRVLDASAFRDAGRSETVEAEATGYPWTSWLTMPERDAVPIIRRTASVSFIGASDTKLQTEARAWLSEKAVPERDMGSDSAFPWDA